MLRTLAMGLLVSAVACGSGGGQAKKASTTTAPAGAMQLTSPAFADGAAIPSEFTCDGAGQSPPLSWGGAPSGTSTFALRVQDVDTPQKFVHWLVYDIAPSTTSIAAGQSPPGAKQTANSFGRPGYGGPCPPSGSRHRYVFTLLALGTQLTVSDNLSPNELWSTLERSNVLARGELTGTYQRTR